ncbi:MAG: hypothetical protein JKY33_06815, partial [Bacteroidia bacterium]|nr:hypothetical protein [Bacteroidia bacterium]
MLWSTNPTKLISGILFAILLLTVNINSYGAKLWDGGVSTDWNDANNWQDDVLPDAQDIIIPDVSGASGNFPVLSAASSFTPKKIQVKAGATLTMNGTASVTVNGDLDIIGTLTCTAGTITMGTSGKKIKGAGSINLFNITINSSVQITHDGTATNINVAGDFTNNGTWVDGSGKITFNGSGNQNFDCGGDEFFH